MGVTLGTRIVRGMAKRVYRLVMGPAVTEDPVRNWRGTACDDMPLLRVMHVGDCSIRAMETSHDFKAPVGYPKVAAERLLAEGIGIEFGHYFSITYEYLPEIERLARVTKLTGAPDLVIVHTGATYQRRVILNSTPRVNQLRLEVGRRLGRRIFTLHRLFVRPFVRLFGRHWNPYNGTELLEQFLDRVEEAWPQATVVLVAPFLNSWIYPTSGPIIEQVVADGRALADRRGLPFIHFEALSDDDSLRCCNGYNSGTVGIALLGTLTTRDATPAARSALEDLLAWEADRHGIDPQGSSLYINPVNGTQATFPNIAGHRDLAATECPGGAFYATLPTIRADVATRLSGGTPTPAPSAVTGSASSVGVTSATLNGSINPNGQPTSYQFEYGTSTAYGRSTPTSSAGSGTSGVPVSASLTGLSRNTTYHFRLVAIDAQAHRYPGADATFRTRRK